MKRCAICDYLEGHGADWLGVGKDKRMVVWRAAHQEYQCSECYDSIRTTKQQQEMDDVIKILDRPDEYDEVCEVPFTLSKVSL